MMSKRLLIVSLAALLGACAPMFSGCDRLNRNYDRMKLGFRKAFRAKPRGGTAETYAADGAASSGGGVTQTAGISSNGGSSSSGVIVAEGDGWMLINADNGIPSSIPARPSGHGVSVGNPGRGGDMHAAAEAGDPAAQYNLGCDYYFGAGVPQNKSQAVYWFRKSAEQGFAKAQCMLGMCYKQGEGVPYDLDKAEYWTRMAAEQGDFNAQGQLIEIRNIRRSRGSF